MPRTGTTLLSRLMGQDPQLRAPLLWEMAMPYFTGGWEKFQKDSMSRKMLLGYRKCAYIVSVPCVWSGEGGSFNVVVYCGTKPTDNFVVIPKKYKCL